MKRWLAQAVGMNRQCEWFGDIAEAATHNQRQSVRLIDLAFSFVRFVVYITPQMQQNCPMSTLSYTVNNNGPFGVVEGLCTF